MAVACLEVSHYFSCRLVVISGASREKKTFFFLGKEKNLRTHTHTYEITQTERQNEKKKRTEPNDRSEKDKTTRRRNKLETAGRRAENRTPALDLTPSPHSKPAKVNCTLIQ